MNGWKVILATAAIFCTGFFAGLLFPKMHPPARTGGGAPASVSSPLPNDRRIAAIRQFTQDLDLTPEQQQQVDLLVDESQERTRVMWELIGPEVQDEFRRMRGEVVRVLTPEQRKRFEERSRKYRRERARESGGTNAPVQPADKE